MSSMAEQEFQENGGGGNGVGIIQPSSLVDQTQPQQQQQPGQQIPTPPSSTQSQSITPPPHSSSSSTCSTTIKSPISPTNTQQQQQQQQQQQVSAAAAAAAVAQLFGANGQLNTKSLLTPKEMAKLNIDVKNFKIDQFNPNLANFNDFNHQLSAQIESLYQQQLMAKKGSMMANINAMNVGNGVIGSGGGGGGHRSRKPLQDHKKQQQQQQQHRLDDNEMDNINGSMGSADDDEDASTLNLCLKQRRRNGEIIKGSISSHSLSPSPRGGETSCSEESPIKSESPSCGSSITHDGQRLSQNSKSHHHHHHHHHHNDHSPSLHDQTTNDDCSNDRSCSPSSSRSISPSMTSSYRDDNLTTPYSNVDPSLLSHLPGLPNYANLVQNGNTPNAAATAAAVSLVGLNGQQNGGMTAENLAAALTANAAANLPLTSNVSTMLASRKRRNERDSNERNKKIKPVPDEKKDDAYWERRRKNNEAAKRSRDLRRQKEDEIAVRAAFLEQENLKLRAQVTILKAELSKLHFMIYNR